jgi:hypothetical protein
MEESFEAAQPIDSARELEPPKLWSIRKRRLSRKFRRGAVGSRGHDSVAADTILGKPVTVSVGCS